MYKLAKDLGNLESKLSSFLFPVEFKGFDLTPFLLKNFFFDLEIALK